MSLAARKNLLTFALTFSLWMFASGSQAGLTLNIDAANEAIFFTGSDSGTPTGQSGFLRFR